AGGVANVSRTKSFRKRCRISTMSSLAFRSSFESLLNMPAPSITPGWAASTAPTKASQPSIMKGKRDRRTNSVIIASLLYKRRPGGVETSGQMIRPEGVIIEKGGEGRKRKGASTEEKNDSFSLEPKATAGPAVAFGSRLNERTRPPLPAQRRDGPDR